MSRIAQNIRNPIVTNKSSKCPIFPIFPLFYRRSKHWWYLFFFLTGGAIWSSYTWDKQRVHKAMQAWYNHPSTKHILGNKYKLIFNCAWDFHYLQFCQNVKYIHFCVYLPTKRCFNSDDALWLCRPICCAMDWWRWGS